jgi:hypothetical protein
MKTVVKVFCMLSGLCALSVLFLCLSVANASVDSEMKRYDSANEKQFVEMEKAFKCQYDQFAGHKNIIVVSMSKNFENSNCVRAWEVIPDAKLRLTDYKGRTETVSVKELQTNYECYMMAKAPVSFDTTGNLSSNFNAMAEK